MSARYAQRALEMARTKLLEAGQALARAETYPGISTPLQFVLTLAGRDHIRGAILQAIALLEQVEEEREDDQDPAVAIAAAVRVIGESQEMRQLIQQWMDRLNRGEVAHGEGEEAAGEK